MASNKDYSNHIVGGTILIIVILVGIFFATQNRSASGIVDSKKDAMGESTTTQPTSSFMAADQTAGMSVMVSGIQVAGDSWVAVREADGSRVLGAALVTAGTKSATVELLRATVAGKSYEVVIYTDDGDRAFDMKKDALVSGVRDAFNAQ